MKTENNGLVPSILHLWSMFPRLSLAPLVQLEHAKRVCWFCIHHCWGKVEVFWSGSEMLNKSRGGGWRDFSCPGQEVRPWPPRSFTPALLSLPSLPSSPWWWMMICVTLSLPASTGGSASSMLACFWLNRRSELTGDMWHLRHSNPRTSREGGGGGLPGWKKGHL